MHDNRLPRSPGSRLPTSPYMTNRNTFVTLDKTATTDRTGLPKASRKSHATREYDVAPWTEALLSLEPNMAHHLWRRQGHPCLGRPCCHLCCWRQARRGADHRRLAPYPGRRLGHHRSIGRRRRTMRSPRLAQSTTMPSRRSTTPSLDDSPTTLRSPAIAAAQCHRCRSRSGKGPLGHAPRPL